MRAVDIIAKKRDGKQLDGAELKFMVEEFSADRLPDYQMAAFLMAVFFRSMNPEELAVWADAMLNSGEIIDLSGISGYKVDKHSTGGVGDKISLILAPLAVAAGLKVPMISGRGLGHTGGTLDKLESIPGFNVNLSVDEFKKMVGDVGMSLIGQTAEVAPADKRLYALRDVTATVECIPLIASSIMSKKLAEGINGLVLDVKVGSGAFMKDLDSARALARTMIDIGTRMNCDVTALITDMNQPLGLTIGNALEVRESIETLRGEGPKDIEDLTVELVWEMGQLAHKGAASAPTREQLLQILKSGKALPIFEETIRRQGGDARVCQDLSLLPTAQKTLMFESPEAGVITSMNAQTIGLAATDLGAGRATKEDTIDPAVGLVMLKKLGDRVEKGEPILEMHVNPTSNLEGCVQRLQTAFVFGEKASHNGLFLDRLVAE
jgi:pyrimidine-nucleoside phosphorylase